MMQTILAFFGYAKIPTEAVRLSMLIEDNYRGITERLPDNEIYALLYESSKTLTDFLRSGKLLNEPKENTFLK